MKRRFQFFLLIIVLHFPTLISSQSSATYIVLSSVEQGDPYYQTVELISNYRDAEIVQFNPEEVESVLPTLTDISPRYVAVVIKPLELQINFIRRFLMMSTQLDGDPFSDFAYGYITGATAQDALDFVNRIIMAESENIQNYPLKVGGYAASSINFVYPLSGDYLQYLNPASYAIIYMETNDNGSGRDFFLANTSYMLNNKILDIGHNGDPHMLWLFEGGNINPDPPVWLYDPSKIENPAYARMGLTSNDIGALNLYPAVAFNGACHAGETKTVMVEGDIAATFGNTQGLVKFYTMSDSFSYALSILKTGITGYFAPCGANNANDQSEDVYNAFLYNEPLGDIFKRSIDGMVMGFLGNPPNLRIFVENSSTYQSDVLPSGTFNPDDWSGAYYMLGGKANRIYFGDPLFNPYQNNHSDELNITTWNIVPVNNSTFDINLAFNKPDSFEAYFPVWDKFHYGNTRIYAAIELPSEYGEITTFQVSEYSGPFDMIIHASEDFESKKILHIEVDIPNDMYDQIDYYISFRVTCVTSGIETYASVQKLSINPNPADKFATIECQNPGHETLLLAVYNSQGQKIKQATLIDGYRFILDTSGFGGGLYYVSVRNNTRLFGQGKLLVK